MFRFNIGDESKEKLAGQQKIINRNPFDPMWLQIYLAVARGLDFDSFINALKSARHEVTDPREMRDKFETVVADYRRAGVKNFKSLMREFAAPGLVDPIGKTVHGITTQDTKDFGLISIAANPFSENAEHVSVFVAGIHGPGTAQGVKLLSRSEAFETHPFGGIFEVTLPHVYAWHERMTHTYLSWETRPYSTKEAIKVF